MKPKSKRAKAKSNRSAKPVKSAKRATLNALIAAAPTWAQKWHKALTDGKPPLSPIHQLAQNAAGYAEPHSPKTVASVKKEFGLDLDESDALAKNKLKAELADLLFPALVAGNTAPFEQIIQGIRDYRRSQRLCAKTLDELKDRQCQLPSKRERGRLQRLALLNLGPDDLLNIGTAKAAIARFDKHPSGWCLFPEDATIYALMKELEIRFLRPGDAVRWRTEDGRTVRLLQILPDGKPKITGPRNPDELGHFGGPIRCIIREYGFTPCGQKE
jgi:hypothetical protein